MNNKLLLIVGFLCAIKSFSQGLQCSRKNEMLRCEDCPPERTCQNRNKAYNCLYEPNCKRQSCVCKKGFIRNNFNECVPDDICDSCKGPNEFWDCGSACDNECTSIKTQNRTNCPINNIVCNEKCYCIDGYARNSDGLCVPFDKCSGQAAILFSPPGCGNGTAGWWWFFRAGVYYVAYPDCNAANSAGLQAVLPHISGSGN